MPLKFDGSNDYAYAWLDLSGTRQVAISYWGYYDSYNNADGLAMEHTPDTNSNSAFYVDPNGSTGLVNIFCGSGTTSRGHRYTRPATAQWIHFMHQFDKDAGTSMIHTWWNGVFQNPVSNNGVSPTANDFIASYLYFHNRGTASLFGVGRIAEVAVWRNLKFMDAADAMRLYQGASPFDVNGRALIAYWPIDGRSLENVAVNGRATDIIVGGTTVGPTVDDSLFPVTNLAPRGVMTFFGVSEVPIVSGIIDAATVLVDLQVSSVELAAVGDTATAYVDIQPSGPDGVTHFDAVTVLVDIQVHFCEFFVQQPPPEFIWWEYTKWSMESHTKWSEQATTKWQWEVRVTASVGEEICV